MAARQGWVLEFLQRDLAQRDVDPQILVAGREGVPQGIPRALRIAGPPQFQALLVIGLRFPHPARMDQLEIPARKPDQADRAGRVSRPARRRTAPAPRGLRTLGPLAGSPRMWRRGSSTTG